MVDGLIVLAVGYAGWDRFLRKKFIIHICIEEGQRLVEIKSFKKLMRSVGTILHWRISSNKDKAKGEEEQGRSYTIDPTDVLFTDRFNKMHIIKPYDNVFSLHPLTQDGKLKLEELAHARSDSLYQTINRGGVFSRLQALRKSLNKIDRGTAIILAIGFISVGLMIGYNVLPHYVGAPSGFEPISTNATLIYRTVTHTTSISPTIFTGHAFVGIVTNELNKSIQRNLVVR